MTNSHFMTPNGLPAPGQLTTARDIAKLSVAYLRRFPESLSIHSLQSYCYGRSSHHNANRLLGKCPGVDGLKTGFVCAAGYNITATAKRGGVRILAVVMGARSPWIRLTETEKLIEAGFRECGSPYSEVKCAAGAEAAKDVQTVIHAEKESRRSHSYARRHGDAGARLAGIGAGVGMKKTISHKISAREKTKLAVKSSTRTKSDSGSSHFRRARAGQAVAKKSSEKLQSARAGSGKSNKAAGIEKTKSAGKQRTRTALLKKKTPAYKHAPRAQVSRRKAAG
jgi:D-alanyl-D-alanine carboxypeptidase (penicillin-binding protein 5/6)